MTNTPDNQNAKANPAPFGRKAASDIQTEREARRLRQQLDQQGKMPWLVRAAVWLVSPAPIMSRGLLMVGLVCWTGIGATGAIAVTEHLSR